MSAESGGVKMKIFTAASSNDPESILHEIDERISSLKISDENKNKLKARNHKKLILSERQLTVSTRPEEKGEAGGLDHRAKIQPCRTCP